MSSGPFLSSSWYRVAGLRPKLREHVSVSRHRYRGSTWYVIHDHVTGRAHRLSTASYMIVGGMDGSRTVDQLWHDATVRLGQEAPSQNDLIQLLAQLHTVDLLQSGEVPDSTELVERAGKTDRRQWIGNLANPLAFRVRFWHPDRFFDRTAPYVSWLVSWRGFVLWMMVVLPAILLMVQHWRELTENATDRILAADNLVMMAAVFIILKALHELGHGYAIKTFGGAVYEIGIMFLVFAPMPYVDASAASEFRSKWHRVIVGAAGMIVEVFIASLALYLWLAVEQGLVRAIAYNVMVVAGISTILFNANPLLRYDGYYILVDLMEIPNLAQRSTRYWNHLIYTYVFRAKTLPEHVATSGERIWFLLYGPASFLYRVFVIFAIAVFVASKYLAVGVAVAIWGFSAGVVLPVGKALWNVVTSPHLQRTRASALALTTVSIVIFLAVLFGVPAPFYATTEGVLWLPESARVRAETNGFIRRIMIEPGERVSFGEALIESEEPALKSKLELLRARVTELETVLVLERFKDRVKAQLAATELGYARAELENESDRARRLVTRSQRDGIFAVADPHDLPGRFVKEGQLLGYVLPQGSRIVRATIRQDDIGLVRNRLKHVSVVLAERVGEAFPARIVREVPAGRDDLPSRALGGTGGGVLPIDPRDSEGTKTLQRVFQVDIELPPDAAAHGAFGGRAYVRFDFQWEPFGNQIWRRLRQLLLSRLQT